MSEFKSSGEFATTWVGGLGLIQGEEIVRCRDCKEFAFGDVEYGTVDWCDYWGSYVESPDGFCSWGVRA